MPVSLSAFKVNSSLPWLPTNLSRLVNLTVLLLLEVVTSTWPLLSLLIVQFVFVFVLMSKFCKLSVSCWSFPWEPPSMLSIVPLFSKRKISTSSPPWRFSIFLKVVVTGVPGWLSSLTEPWFSPLIVQVKGALLPVRVSVLLPPTKFSIPLKLMVVLPVDTLSLPAGSILQLFVAELLSVIVSFPPCPPKSPPCSTVPPFKLNWSAPSPPKIVLILPLLRLKISLPSPALICSILANSIRLLLFPLIRTAPLLLPVIFQVLFWLLPWMIFVALVSPTISSMFAKVTVPPKPLMLPALTPVIV